MGVTYIKSISDNIVKFMLKQPVFVRSQLDDCSTLKEELSYKTGDPWIDFVTKPRQLTLRGRGRGKVLNVRDHTQAIKTLQPSMKGEG